MKFLYPNKILLNVIVIIGAVCIQSCSSLFYKEKLQKKNNTFHVSSNYPNYQVAYSNDKNQNVSTYQNSVYIENLKRKNTYFTFTHDGCYDINIKVKRVPRVGAVLLDLPLSVFFLAPYAIDVFRADFYKIARQSRSINLKFQRTPEYFRSKINEAQKDLNPVILDSILLENPDEEIRAEIEKQRVLISKTILYYAIEKTINHRQNTLESYYDLVSKYPQSIPECLIVLDSLKNSICQEELNKIRKNADLFRIIELTKISDKALKDSLVLLKPEIQNYVFKELYSNLDFVTIDKIINIEDSISAKSAVEFKLSMEKKAIETIEKTNDLALLNRIYGNMSRSNQEILDRLRPIVIKFNDVELLRKRIREIENLSNYSKNNEALELLNKTYPNQYPETLAENKTLNVLKNKITIDIDITALSEIIISDYYYDVENARISQYGQTTDEVLLQITKLKSQNLTTTQKSNLDRLKKQFITARIESVKYYVNNGGFNINEINSLLKLGPIDITAAQKKLIQSYKLLAEKNYKTYQEKIKVNYSANNYEYSDNYTTESNASMVLCASESGYDYVRYYKLYFYSGGVVQIEVDNGSKNSGKFTTYQNNVYVRFPGFTLVLEPGYGNNYIDKEGREWRTCW